MEDRIEADHFQVLEEKVGSLIEKLISLRDEKLFLEEKVQEQERSIANLSGELKKLKDIRDNTKDRITSILEKIEKIDI